MKLILATGLLCLSSWGQQTPKSADDAAQTIQSLRIAGRNLLETKPEEALAKFTAAWDYANQPLVKDLARGDFFLEGRTLNLCIDFADTYAKLGRKSEAINWLERVHQAGGWGGFAQFLEQSPSLAGVRGEPAFATLLATVKERKDFWESPALKTPYTANLSPAEKVAGLSKFWSEVKYNFAYPEVLREMDWDRVYLETIPKVMATQSTEDYYRELMRLCALLKDGHTNVYFPQAIRKSSKPPLQTMLIEGRVAITAVNSDDLEKMGVTAGMEILAVDGEDVHAYVKREVMPFQSASTPGDLTLRSYWYGFLRGSQEQPVRLKLRGRDGTVVEKELPRKGYKTRSSEDFEFRELGNGVAYVRLDQFENQRMVARWKEKLPQILAAKALIIDLRGNGGGSSGIGFAMLSDLIDKPAHSAMTRMRRYIPTERAWGRGEVQFVANAPGEVEPTKGQRFTGPVAVLTSAATYSAAEDFLLAYRDSARGKIVGETSGGSTGQPLFFNLPGGGSARVCTKQDLAPDGTKWVGVGIKPDVEVKPLWADFAAGKDTVLDAAVKLVSR